MTQTLFQKLYLDTVCLRCKFFFFGSFCCSLLLKKTTNLFCIFNFDECIYVPYLTVKLEKIEGKKKIEEIVGHE